MKPQEQNKPTPAYQNSPENKDRNDVSKKRQNGDQDKTRKDVDKDTSGDTSRSSCGTK